MYGVQHLLDYWEAGGDLISGFACGLEDEQLLLLLAVAVQLLELNPLRAAAATGADPTAVKSISDAVQVLCFAATSI